ILSTAGRYPRRIGLGAEGPLNRIFTCHLDSHVPIEACKTLPRALTAVNKHLAQGGASTRHGRSRYCLVPKVNTIDNMPQPKLLDRPIYGLETSVTEDKELADIWLRQAAPS